MQEKNPESPRPQEIEQETYQLPDTSPETSPERERREQIRPREEIEQTEKRLLHVQQQAQTARSIDPELEGIETILASGLDSFFLSLSPEEQLTFKRDGETTAIKIREALHKHATKIKDIVRLIINWLKKIPGINRFFLEQEAKIKADAIVRRYKP